MGHLKDRHAPILLFPKSIRRFAEQRIIAVDYALFAKGGTSIPGKDPPVPEKVLQKSPRWRFEPGSDPKREKANRPSPQKTALPAAPASPAKIGALSLPEVMAVVRRAVNELAAGKLTPADERLKGLRMSNGASS